MSDRDFAAERAALKASFPEGGLKLKRGSESYRLWKLALRTPGVKPSRKSVERRASQPEGSEA